MRFMHLVISGRVQGVGFRAWTARHAQAKGLLGWVKNLSDGTVEAFVQGEAEVVADFKSILSEGPTYADVSEVRVLEEGQCADANGFTDFEVRR